MATLLAQKFIQSETGQNLSGKAVDFVQQGIQSEEGQQLLGKAANIAQQGIQSEEGQQLLGKAANIAQQGANDVTNKPKGARDGLLDIIAAAEQARNNLAESTDDPPGKADTTTGVSVDSPHNGLIAGTKTGAKADLASVGPTLKQSNHQVDYSKDTSFYNYISSGFKRDCKIYMGFICYDSQKHL